jgi:Flp pilus assembly protein TadG
MSAQAYKFRSYKVRTSLGIAPRKVSKTGDLQKLEPTPEPDRTKRQGAAVVEFAVLAPLLFLLVFGMLEYGRLIMVQQIITNASREGCRQAVLEGASSSAIDSFVQSYLSNSSISNATVGISPDPAVAGPGDPMTVTVSVNFDDVSWLPTSLYLGGRVLSASSTMRRETAQ